MMSLMRKNLLFLSIISIIGWACQSSSDKGGREAADESASEDSALLAQAQLFFQPLEASVPENPDNPITPEKFQLGKMLYYEKALSKDHKISCNSCHDIARFGVDNLPTSPGNDGQNGERNSPTTLNAAFHIAQFWDGRAKDVEEQAGGPILNPIEMAMPSEAAVVKRLSNTPPYPQLFKEAFPDTDTPLTFTHIRQAIAAFERTLVTPTRFDEYLKGDIDALSKEEKEGLKTFIEVGCITCHKGKLLGGDMFQKFGVVKEYWTLTGSTHIDSGRYKVTRNEADLFVFKVPSLRNIAKTAPYFHDGSVASLDQAVQIMAEAQLGRKLTEEQTTAIVAFLQSLTGEIKAGWLMETTTDKAVN